MTAVYVIAAEGGPVKVGMATDPEKRLRQLSTGTPYKLRLAHVEDAAELSVRKIEAAAHTLLSRSRVHGEWFAVSVDEARAAIHQAMEQLRDPEPRVGRPRKRGTMAPGRTIFSLPDEVRAGIKAFQDLEKIPVQADAIRRLLWEGLALRQNGTPGVRLRDPLP